MARRRYDPAMRLRLARIDDAEAIRAIYNYEVSHGTNTFDLVPRTGEEQRAWIARHQGAHPAVVAVAGGGDGGAEPAEEVGARAGGTGGVSGVGGGAGGDRVGGGEEAVLGFGVLSPYRDRPAYATTVEDSVYVDRHRRGQGVGRALLEELLRLAAAQGFHTVIARISGHNDASIRLHERCGFTVVGVEREVGRKHRQWLDVVELQRML